MADTIAIEIRNVVKRYGDVTALKGASLTIRDNEFFTLLGPSGCGKTTLLRMIAGFEDVTDGAIFLFGEEIENLSPHQRPINTVFQQYALFPHMTVAQNVAFGLKMLGRSKADCDNRAAEMLALVKLSDFAARYPAQLSGGQQQRVALARALAPGPKVLLLDEPLSALDLKLRQDMRVELKQLQKETGITFVFVTHDQEEALTMSDRIAVMSAGEIRQIGAPVEIYEAPADRFVADFIGETNILNVKIASLTQGVATCTLGNTEIQCPAVQGLAVGAAASLSVRPERFTIDPSREAATLQGAVSQLVYLGTDTQAFVDLDGGQQVMVRTQNAHGTTPRVAEGDHVGLSIDPGAARLLVD